MIIKELPEKRFGQIFGATEWRIWRMLFAQLTAAQARLNSGNIVWVGANQMNRRNGHNYLKVFAKLLAKRQ